MCLLCVLCPAGPAPADPLDDLDSMLGSARKAPSSARERIAAGFSRLLAPLRSARKGGEAQWARQLSTPRSWGASSGEQNTWQGAQKTSADARCVTLCS